jgi:hypothetical protein
LYQHQWNDAVVDHHEYFNHLSEQARRTEPMNERIISPHVEPRIANVRPDDLYSGHDANVYRRTNDGKWQRYQNNAWQHENDWARPYTVNHTDYGYARPSWDRGWNEDRWREQPIEHLNDEYRARDWGEAQYNGFRESGYHGGGYHGGRR